MTKIEIISWKFEINGQNFEGKKSKFEIENWNYEVKVGLLRENVEILTLYGQKMNKFKISIILIKAVFHFYIFNGWILASLIYLFTL